MANSSYPSSRRTWPTAILSILMAFCLSLSVVTLVLKQTLLNEDLNMQIIQEQKIDQKAAAILPGVLFEKLTANAAPAVSALLADPSTGIANTLIPPDWVNATLRLGVRSFIDTLESGESVFSLKLDLTPVKQAMTGTASDLTAKVIDQMPACTAQQLLSFAGSMLSSGTSTLPFCKPGEPFTHLVTPLVENWIAGMASQIPAAYEIPVANLSAEEGSKTSLMQALKVVQAVLPYGKIAPAACLVLLLLILGINWKTLPFGIRWIGAAFLIAAIFLLIGIGITAGFVGNLDLTRNGATPLMAELSQLAGDYIRAMQSQMQMMLIKSGALFGGSGLLLLLIARKDRFVWQD